MRKYFAGRDYEKAVAVTLPPSHGLPQGVQVSAPTKLRASRRAVVVPSESTHLFLTFRADNRSPLAAHVARDSHAVGLAAVLVGFDGRGAVFDAARGRATAEDCAGEDARDSVSDDFHTQRISQDYVRSVRIPEHRGKFRLETTCFEAKQSIHSHYNHVFMV